MNTSQRAALIRSFETQAVATANAREARAAAANGESDPYKFAAGERTIKEGDLDGDGDQDAVVLTLICEEINCHATTQSSVAGLLINDGDHGVWRRAVCLKAPGLSRACRRPVLSSQRWSLALMTPTAARARNARTPFGLGTERRRNSGKGLSG